MNRRRGGASRLEPSIRRSPSSQSSPSTAASTVSPSATTAVTEAPAGRALADIPEQERLHIFGKGGAHALADELKVPFMAEVPLVQSIREAADVGRPAVLQGDTPAAQAFTPLLDAMQRILAELDAAPTRKKVATQADEMSVKP